MRRAGDNCEQHDSSFTQTIKSNKLDQGSGKQFLYIFGGVSALLVDNGFGSLLSLVFVGQGFERAEVSLSRDVEEFVEVLVGAPAAL